MRIILEKLALNFYAKKYAAMSFTSKYENAKN